MDAGSYTVVATADADDTNYRASGNSSFEVVITPKEVEFTVAELPDMYYGGDAYKPEPAVTYTEDGEVDYINDSSSWIDGVGDFLTNPFAFEFRFLPYGETNFGKDISVITCMKDGKYIFNNEWMAVPQYAPGAKSFTAQKHME